jgi:hypothetical protein
MSYRAKKHIITGITLLFIFLFTYTAASKVSNMNAMVGSIARHPLLSTYSQTIAWTVIVLEFGTVLMLLLPSLRTYGLWLSAILMVAFTFYIGSMLWMLEKLPCSCGGIIQDMSWLSHLILNIFLTLLAVAGLIVDKQLRKHYAWS